MCRFYLLRRVVTKIVEDNAVDTNTEGIDSNSIGALANRHVRRVRRIERRRLSVFEKQEATIVDRSTDD